MSPYETIDLQNTPQVNSVVYHPLVTVEISECTKNLLHQIFLVYNNSLSGVNSSSTADPTYIVSLQHF